MAHLVIDSILHHLSQSHFDARKCCGVLTWHSKGHQMQVCSFKAISKPAFIQHLKTVHMAELHDVAGILRCLNQSGTTACALCEDTGAMHQNSAQHLLKEHWGQLQAVSACIHKLQQSSRCAFCDSAMSSQPAMALQHLFDHHLPDCLHVACSIMAAAKSAQSCHATAKSCTCPYSTQGRLTEGPRSPQGARMASCGAGTMTVMQLYCHLQQTHWQQLLAQHGQRSASIMGGEAPCQVQQAVNMGIDEHQRASTGTLQHRDQHATGTLQRQSSIQLWMGPSGTDELLPTDHEVEEWLCAAEPTVEPSQVPVEMLPTEDEVEAWLRSAETQPVLIPDVSIVPEPASAAVWRLSDLEACEPEDMSFDKAAITAARTAGNTDIMQHEANIVQHNTDTMRHDTDVVQHDADIAQPQADDKRHTESKVHDTLAGQAGIISSHLDITQHADDGVSTVAIAHCGYAADTALQQDDDNDSDSVYSCNSAGSGLNVVGPISKHAGLVNDPLPSVASTTATCNTSDKGVCSMLLEPGNAASPTLRTHTLQGVAFQQPHAIGMSNAAVVAGGVHNKVNFKAALTTSGTLLTSLPEDTIGTAVDSPTTDEGASTTASWAQQDSLQRRVQRVSSVSVSGRQTRQDSHLSTATSFQTACSIEELPAA